MALCGPWLDPAYKLEQGGPIFSYSVVRSSDRTLCLDSGGSCNRYRVHISSEGTFRLVTNFWSLIFLG